MDPKDQQDPKPPQEGKPSDKEPKPPTPDPLAELEALRKRNEILETEKKAANNEAASYRKKVRASEDEKKRLEEEALKKKGEFETLYNSEKKRADEAAQQVEKLSAYQLRFRADVDARVNALPPEARTLIPEGLDDEARLMQVEKVTKALAASGSPPKPPITPTAPPTGSGPTKDPNISNLTDGEQQELGYTGTSPARRQQLLAKASATTA